MPVRISLLPVGTIVTRPCSSTRMWPPLPRSVITAAPRRRSLRRSSLLVTPEIVRPPSYFIDNARIFAENGMNETALVQKVWNYAHVLRDQGVPYQAYISQISYLLFLKMDDERAGLVASGLRPHQGRGLGDPRGLPLARVARPAGRGAHPALYGDPRQTVAALRHRRHDFSQSAERDPGPGQAAAPRRAYRRRDLARARCRRQRLDL